MTHTVTLPLDEYNTAVEAARELLRVHEVTGINLARFGPVGEFVKNTLGLPEVPDNGV